MAVASSLNPPAYGASVTFTATAPAGATGTVTFEDNGTPISGALPISGTMAIFTTSALLAGTHPIIAVYSGDSNYNGANLLVLTQTVNISTTGPSTTLSVSPTTVIYGDGGADGSGRSSDWGDGHSELYRGHHPARDVVVGWQ